MICSVFKPSRTQNGKRIRQRLYWGQYRLDGHVKVTRIPLKTPDKQVAEERLRKLVVDAQKVAEGLAPSIPVRQAAEKLNVHLDSFLAELKARGNSALYIYDTERNINNLMAECRWVVPADINAISFETWRTKHSDKAPKTLNMDLAAIRNFVRWMCQRNLLEKDPLSVVAKVKTNGRQVRPRRAFTAEEMRRLLAVADWRAPMYLTAYHTGLRRAELQALIWGDLNLEAPKPYVAIRASTSKNRKRAILPLHRDVVTTLRSMRPVDVSADSLVFRHLSRLIRFKKDLKAAGIPYKDVQGRYLDFHSFRHTTCTNLAMAGVGVRTAMELMRHSDAKLTNTVYTDATQLHTAEAVESVPSVLDGGSQLCAQIDAQKIGKDAQIDLQTPDSTCPAESRSVKVQAVEGCCKMSENKDLRHDEARGVTLGQNNGDGGRYRTRTCDLLHVRQAL
jgi:integrase